jgi:hypothetical protein
MKHVKSITSSILLLVLCVGVAWAEYDLAMRFPIIFSVVSVFALLTLLDALRRAPRGCENEYGFHIPMPCKPVHLPRHALGTSGSRI